MSITKQEAERQIKMIFKVFDWKRVQRAMEAVCWEWSTVKKNEYGYNIPDVQALKKSAKNLLLRVCHGSDGLVSNYIHCGGFVATRRAGYLKLQFILDECNVEEIEYGSPRHTIKQIQEICK